MDFTLLVFCVNIRCILFDIILLRAALCKACALNERRVSEMDWIVSRQLVIPQIIKKKCNVPVLFY